METERETLERGISLIDELLLAHGFKRYSGDHDGVSSGGRFATCEYRRRDLRLELVVRSKTGLGCPNYSEGNGYAGHSDVIKHLGCSGVERLIGEEYGRFRDRHGGDPFDAFKHDLERILLPALKASKSAFRDAIRKTQEEFMGSLRGEDPVP